MPSAETDTFKKFVDTYNTIDSGLRSLKARAANTRGRGTFQV